MTLQARFGVVNGMARSVAPREIRPSMVAFYSTKTKGKPTSKVKKCCFAFERIKTNRKHSAFNQAANCRFCVNCFSNLMPNVDSHVGA